MNIIEKIILDIGPEFSKFMTNLDKFKKIVFVERKEPKPFYFLFFIFSLILSLGAQAVAAKTNSWLETQENISKLGIEKIWFTSDLNKAVFLRAHRQINVNHLNKFLNLPIQINPKMSHLEDTLYFYNMDHFEIKNWVKKSFPIKNNALWLSLFVSKAFADSSNCLNNKSPSFNELKEGDSFYKKFIDVVNGDFLKKMVGCSTQDPNINEKQNESLSIKNFATVLTEHWQQLKEIILQLPSMPLPDDMKQELLCDGLSLGIFVAEGAVLTGLTGVGAYVVVPRLYLALKRLLQTAKYLKKYKEKTKDVYQLQKKFIKNLQRDANQILDELKVSSQVKREQIFSEIKINADTELGLQKDLLKTLSKLEKAQNRSKFGNQISINAEKVMAEKRIQVLEKLRTQGSN